jgi:hypothetical protein
MFDRAPAKRNQSQVTIQSSDRSIRQAMQPANQSANERVGGLPKEERAAQSGWFPNKQNAKRPATCELASCATTLGERGIGELIRVIRMCTVSVVETGVISHAECNCRATMAGNHQDAGA